MALSVLWGSIKVDDSVSPHQCGNCRFWLKPAAHSACCTTLCVCRSADLGCRERSSTLTVNLKDRKADGNVQDLDKGWRKRGVNLQIKGCFLVMWLMHWFKTSLHPVGRWIMGANPEVKIWQNLTGLDLFPNNWAIWSTRCDALLWLYKPRPCRQVFAHRGSSRLSWALF